ncbi:hypothetical protein AJ87_03335 [Rhizobium yanglingense]|nr:hypothetical protein AJ87_03335 [Rhizobium yanglingense]
MNRETTNRIRFVLEDILPPFVRDSGAFRWAARRVWGDHITHLAKFRERAPFLSAEEYAELYRKHPRFTKARTILRPASAASSDRSRERASAISAAARVRCSAASRRRILGSTALQASTS